MGHFQLKYQGRNKSTYLIVKIGWHCDWLHLSKNIISDHDGLIWFSIMPRSNFDRQSTQSSVQVKNFENDSWSDVIGLSNWSLWNISRTNPDDKAILLSSGPCSKVPFFKCDSPSNVKWAFLKHCWLRVVSTAPSTEICQKDADLWFGNWSPILF